MSSSIRNAFIRVHANNDTKEGQIVYNLAELYKILKDWAQTAKLTYWIVEHTPDDECQQLHFHIVIKFSSPMPFPTIKNRFPYGDIQSARGLKACVQYLVHLNDLTKKQYTWADVLTNCTDMAPYMVKTDSQNEITLITVVKDIERGKIREYNQYELIPIELWAKYKTRIENALTHYRERVCMDKSRSIKVLFFTGDTGTGKTTLAKRFGEKTGKSCCISSSSNDPMQDYKGEDILILDDLRDSSFSFTDLIKILDNHTGSTVRSRYHNKAFIGDTIIITSHVPLEQWYQGVPEHRGQLMRRISQVYTFTKDTVVLEAYNEETKRHEYEGEIANFITMEYKKKEQVKTALFDALGVKMTKKNEEKFRSMTAEQLQQELPKDWKVK